MAQIIQYYKQEHHNSYNCISYVQNEKRHVSKNMDISKTQNMDISKTQIELQEIKSRKSGWD